MAKYQTKDIRNIAILGHGGAGKTTLAEAMLFKAGAVKRAGSVDDGTSILDFDAEEKERKFSIDPAVVFFSHKSREFNLTDSPGYPDFLGGAISAIVPAETCLICVSAADGVQVNTRRMWEESTKAGIARIVVLTKMDADNINLPELMDSLKQDLGPECVPSFVCDSTGAGFNNVADLLTPSDQLPAELAEQAEELATQLSESIVEQDDELMNRYLEGQEITNEELRNTLMKSVATGQLVPVLAVSARKDVGVDVLLDFLGDVAPSPEDGLKRKGKKGEEEIEVQPDLAGPFCAQVFRCVTDPFVGKLSYFRVLRGRLTGELSITNVRTGEAERCGHLLRMFGKEQHEVDEAIPGDIVAVPKLEGVQFGDTLCANKDRIELPEPVFPTPMMPLAVEPQSRGDEQRLSTALQRLGDEDPTFVVRRDKDTGELIVSGMSMLHLEVVLSRMKRRFDVSVETKQPDVPYQETCTVKSEAKYRHKKQTGGRGQYGEVFLRLEPQERGAGFEFVDEIVGGVIPKQYIPACEKGIREAMGRGVLAGYHVVDVRTAVYYGSYHDVDSSEAAFKLAASKAFQEAFVQAKPVILEPIVKIDVTVPSQYLGDITGNLTSHRGRIAGMDASGSYQTVSANIPMAEIMQYSAELKSMTGGQGTFSLEFSHYEPVPPHVQQQIIERRKKQKEEE